MSELAIACTFEVHKLIETEVKAETSISTQTWVAEIQTMPLERNLRFISTTYIYIHIHIHIHEFCRTTIESEVSQFAHEKLCINTQGHKEVERKRGVLELCDER